MNDQTEKSIDEIFPRPPDTKFEHGLGTHAASLLYVDLKGGSTRFTALVGVDDEVTDKPIGIRFSLIGDGRDLWKSGVMKKGQAAEKVDVDLTGVKALVRWAKSIFDDGSPPDRAAMTMGPYMIAARLLGCRRLR